MTLARKIIVRLLAYDCIPPGKGGEAVKLVDAVLSDKTDYELALEQALRECMEAYKSVMLSEFETHSDRNPHIGFDWLRWTDLLDKGPSFQADKPVEASK